MGIVNEAIPELLPLGPYQQGLWFSYRAFPGGPLDLCGLAWRVDEAPDSGRLREALLQLMLRHPALRSTFHGAPEGPVQRIHEQMPLPFEEHDLRGHPLAEAMRALDGLRLRPYVLGEEPAWRCCFLRLDPAKPGSARETAIIWFGVHHLAADGASLALLVQELDLILQGRGLPEIDQAEAQVALRGARAPLSESRRRRLQEHWSRRFAVPLPPLDLGFPRPATVSHAGLELCAFPLPTALVTRVEAAAREAGVRAYAVFLAAFGLLLGRLSGRERLRIAAPVSVRRPREAGLVDNLVNRLVMELELRDDEPVAEFLRRVDREATQVQLHSALPFPEIVAAARAQQGDGAPPLVQAGFVWETWNRFQGGDRVRLVDGVEHWSIGEGLWRRLPVPGWQDELPITLNLTRCGETMSGRLLHDPERLGGGDVARLGGSYLELVEALLGDLSAPLGECGLIHGSAKAAHLKRCSGPRLEVEDTTLVARIIAQAVLQPGAAAIRCAGEVLRYGEFVEQAQRIAAALAARGVRRGDRVGVCLPRRFDLVAALLGVMLLGAAYVPIDPAYPEERVRFILDDSAAALLVTTRALHEAVADGRAALLVDDPAIAASTPCEVVGPGADDIAYVIYTSGSTGRPKGVCIPHRCTAVLGAWAAATFPAEVWAGVFASTSICFDLSVFELWVTLSLGGAVILGENALALRDLPERAAVRLLNTVPSAMTALLDAGCVPGGVAVVNLAGEPLRRALVDRVYGLGHIASVWNLYGPSEDTTYSTAALVPRFSSAEPTIGRPVANTRAYVLDAQQRLLPVGVAGELWLSGEKVAAGYLGRPALTAERFLADPFVPGAMMYRSGDRARWGDDGELEFLGRLDHQIKLRGHRIELGEIEARLSGLPGVRAAAAGVLELEGEPRLCAWVEGDSLEADTIREALRARLPAIMVPERIVVMALLPLTPNGKIDRQALPAPSESRSAAPRSGDKVPVDSLMRTCADSSVDLRAAIARVFCEALSIDAIDSDISFFEAGGSSLLLLQVADSLEAMLGRSVPVVMLFEHPTVDRLARALSATNEGPVGPRAESSEVRQRSRDVAVIGMAGRFPGAADVDALWAMSCAGENGLRFLDDADLAAAGVPETIRRRQGYVPVRGILGDVDGFDVSYFGYSPMEAEEMDPQHRLLLECAVHALEDAGCDPTRFAGRIGVFVGASPSAAPGKVAPTPGDGVEWYRWMLAWSRDMLATRIAFKLGLRGPAVNVQTACSTSLVAVHQAIQSLRSGECDLAIAGGVSVIQPAGGGHLYQEGGTLSPDGRCRPFDADAAGIVGGSGVALVVLRAADRAVVAGDRIHAVIRGSAVNNDGHDKMGFLAPSIPGQVEVIRQALADAGVGAETIGYVEAHGTGTRLGDPIEVAALTRAFRQDTGQVGCCALGSVKANIGHLDAAAGVTGLIRAIFAVREGVIPPLAGFRQENPALGLGESPFTIPTAARPWPGPAPRRAGVSAFGLGGTNAHAIVEAPPVGDPSPRPTGPQLLTVSARTPAALETACIRLSGWLEAHPEAELADVAWTLQTGRTHHSFRRALVAADRRATVGALRTQAEPSLANGRPAVAFLFPGVGSQFPGMGQTLYRGEACYARIIDRCHDWLAANADIDLRFLLFPESGDRECTAERLLSPRLHMPAIFATEVALAATFKAYDVVPNVVIGHSLGEYAAAVSAGILTLEGALALVELRGRLCEEYARGAMLAIRASEASVLRHVGARRGVSLAVVNGPEQCVVSGSGPEIAALARDLTQDGVWCRALSVSAALHSPLVEPAMEPLAALASEQTRSPPSIRFISNVVGGEPEGDLICDPQYWATHLREPVRFSDGVMALLEGEQPIILVEVGPGRTLSTLTRQHPAWNALRCQVVTTRLEPEDTMAGIIGALWEVGGSIDWGKNQPSTRRKLSLPGYPFEHERRSVISETRDEARGKSREQTILSTSMRQGLTPTENVLAELWSKALGHSSIDRHDDFFALGGHSLVALEVISGIRSRFGVAIDLDDFLLLPTVAALAARLDVAIGDVGKEQVVSPHEDRLVCLKAGRPGSPPLFLIHPAGGLVFCYADLARRISGERSVYAIRSLASDVDDPEPLSVVRLAGRYREIIESVEPSGPHLLGGASFGGIVAFEIARDLAARGKTGSTVVMWDTPSPAAMKVTTKGLHSQEDIEEYLKELSPALFNTLQSDEELPEHLRSEQFHRLFLRHVQDGATYRPSAYDGPVVYFRAETRDTVNPPRPETEWLEVARGGVNFSVVPGNHISMLVEPHVRASASLLNGLLP